MAIFNSYVSLPEGILHISTLKRRRSHVSRFTFPFWRKKKREKVWFRPATCDLWSRLLATDHHFPSQFDISSDDGRALWTAADGDARQKPWRNLDPQRGEVKGWHSAVGLLKCSWWKWGNVLISHHSELLFLWKLWLELYEWEFHCQTMTMDSFCNVKYFPLSQSSIAWAVQLIWHPSMTK